MAAEFLKRADDRIAIDTATSANDGPDRLFENGYDCVISDSDVPSHNGIEFLEIVREGHPNLPFILYTDMGSEEVASLVSHDLPNPLNVAEGRLALARRGCKSDGVDAVETAHNWMNALIDDLLNLAREGEELAKPIESSWPRSSEPVGRTSARQKRRSSRRQTSWSRPTNVGYNNSSRT